MLNKIESKTKIVSILLLTTSIFLVSDILAAVLLLISLIILRGIVKIPFKHGKYIKNIAFLAVFIILIQTIFAPGNTYIVKDLFNGLVSFKWEGFILGIVIVCRLLALMLLLPLFTETTSCSEIACALNSFGLKYRTAFTITTAFNLIPVFRDEAQHIMDAQKLRGMRSFEKKSVFSGIKAYAGLLIPLMLGAMRKAQSSSVVMDSRAFGAYSTRTWIDKPQMTKKDFWVLFSCFVFSAIILFIN